MEAYTALNTAVAQSGDADAVDVEVFSGDEVVRRNIQAIHAAGKAVVGSNHDFGGTRTRLTCSSACGRCRSWGQTFRRSR